MQGFPRAKAGGPWIMKQGAENGENSVNYNYAEEAIEL